MFLNALVVRIEADKTKKTDYIGILTAKEQNTEVKYDLIVYLMACVARLETDMAEKSDYSKLATGQKGELAVTKGLNIDLQVAVAETQNSLSYRVVSFREENVSLKYFKHTLSLYVESIKMCPGLVLKEVTKSTL